MELLDKLFDVALGLLNKEKIQINKHTRFQIYYERYFYC